MQMQREKYETFGLDGDFAQLLEVSVQYGFVTLFAVAFPLAPLLAWIIGILEYQVAREKLIFRSRRPLPSGARDIGKWYDVMETITSLAIVTNAAILSFTLRAFEDYKFVGHNPFIPFFIILTALYIIRMISRAIFPKLPERYETIIKRHEHIINYNIKGMKRRIFDKQKDSKWLDFTISGIDD